MLKREELLRMFESAGAIRHGHFELSSGLHSGTYVQCAQVLQYPRFAEKLGHALAALFSDATIEVVVSPAMGGVIVGQEVARALPELRTGLVGGGIPAIFVERDASGTMTLRRGFSLRADQHVLIVEDVWTTGGSTLEACDYFFARLVPPVDPRSVLLYAGFRLRPTAIPSRFVSKTLKSASRRDV